MKTVTSVEEFWEVVNDAEKSNNKKIERVVFKDIHVCGEQSEIAADAISTTLDTLDGITFRYCDFKNCIFDKICLSGCEFVCCTFYNCRFYSMIFRDGRFVYTDLNWCDFDECNLERFYIVSTYMSCATFDRSRLYMLEVVNCPECTCITIKKSRIHIRISYSKIHDLDIDSCLNKDIDLRLFCSNIQILKFNNQNSYPTSVRIEYCRIGYMAMNDTPLQIIQISNIGSRGACTMYDAANDHVICGCWSTKTKDGEIIGGSLDEFEERVDKTYQANKSYEEDNFYREEYMKAIELFKIERKEYKNDNK